MTEPFSAPADYRARAHRLREIAERRETAETVREALVMAAEEYERLAAAAERARAPRR